MQRAGNGAEGVCTYRCARHDLPEPLDPTKATIFPENGEDTVMLRRCVFFVKMAGCPQFEKGSSGVRDAPSSFTGNNFGIVDFGF